MNFLIWIIVCSLLIMGVFAGIDFLVHEYQIRQIIKKQRVEKNEQY